MRTITEGTNVLITGITGFVGSYLAKYLLDKGANVYGLYRNHSSGQVSLRLRELSPKVERLKLIEGDLMDISSLARALDISNPDVIFHLAAQSFVPKSFINPIETLTINSLGTANLLEAIRIKGYDPVTVSYTHLTLPTN